MQSVCKVNEAWEIIEDPSERLFRTKMDAQRAIAAETLDDIASSAGEALFSPMAIDFLVDHASEIREILRPLDITIPTPTAPSKS